MSIQGSEIWIHVLYWWTCFDDICSHSSGIRSNPCHFKTDFSACKGFSFLFSWLPWEDSLRCLCQVMVADDCCLFCFPFINANYFLHYFHWFSFKPFILLLCLYIFTTWHIAKFSITWSDALPCSIWVKKKSLLYA